MTVLCETYGLFYITLVAPFWLSAQSDQEINFSLNLFYGLKLQLIYLLPVSPMHVLPVKSKVEISQNFVAFSEYRNFTELRPSSLANSSIDIVRFPAFPELFGVVIYNPNRINNPKISNKPQPNKILPHSVVSESNTLGYHPRMAMMSPSKTKRNC